VFCFLGPQFGYAILAVKGSSVGIVRTNFLNNNFTGLGTVVVLDAGKVNVAMNYGTPDDALKCEFVAASPAGAQNATCIDYDRSSANVSTSTEDVLAEIHSNVTGF